MNQENKNLFELWGPVAVILAVILVVAVVACGCCATQDQQAVLMKAAQQVPGPTESTGGHVVVVVPDLVRIWPFSGSCFFKYTNIVIQLPPVKEERPKHPPVD